ncbi:hypothetical protein [Persicobacter psychrovividus]|uniref:Lipocalin-like domain-containing protein n=1 Tax=Persicobacter psychrovividus TaxID=387638 RepID=A0ABN6LET3_9BACT|nr:hypothetical protein PEPS_39560 [Persicobacter psychrovividus]
MIIQNRKLLLLGFIVTLFCIVSCQKDDDEATAMPSDFEFSAGYYQFSSGVFNEDFKIEVDGNSKQLTKGEDASDYLENSLLMLFSPCNSSETYLHFDENNEVYLVCQDGARQFLGVYSQEVEDRLVRLDLQSPVEYRMIMEDIVDGEGEVTTRIRAFPMPSRVDRSWNLKETIEANKDLIQFVDITVKATYSNTLN